MEVSRAMPEDTDRDREERLSMEILVDCYDEIEQAMGWYDYLQNRVTFPFKAHWSTGSSTRAVDVLRLAHEDDCTKTMMVEIRYWDDQVSDEIMVPLAELHPINPDPDTAEAIADWHYWIKIGYKL